MMIGDAMTPFDPTGGPVLSRFTVDVTVFEVKFDVTVVFFRCYTPPHFSMITFFDITTLYLSSKVKYSKIFIYKDCEY